jgi:hypothetical protein
MEGSEDLPQSMIEHGIQVVETDPAHRMFENTAQRLY